MEELSEQAATLGLTVRGACAVLPEDDLPQAYQTITLLGFLGRSGWDVFQTDRRQSDHPHPHPLDAWSRRVVRTLADQFQAKPVFPFDGPPYYPFQRWAMRAEGLGLSPLGPLIHPEFGLWHSYRGALLLEQTCPPGPQPTADHPCETCLSKPCLSACPVDAVKLEGYDVGACHDHLKREAGKACRSQGCAARLACPIGRDHAYSADQQRFLMRAFVHALG